MRNLLLVGTLIASSFTAASSFAEEGGQQFFFRHHIAGISATDGNPWGEGSEPGEVDEPEVPAEPYTVSPATWGLSAFPVSMASNQQEVGEHGITLSCVGCTSGWEAGASPQGEIAVSVGIIGYDYVSIDFGKEYVVGPINASTSGFTGFTIGLYSGGVLIATCNASGSGGCGLHPVQADEVRLRGAFGGMSPKIDPFLIQAISET